MSPREFVARAVGIPWMSGCSGWSGTDCYGLLLLWHREVLGVDVPRVEETEIAAGFAAARDWVECGVEAGATCFMAFRVDGSPKHCGILLDERRVLHSDGSRDKPSGSVRVTPLRALRSNYGALRYFRYVPPC